MRRTSAFERDLRDLHGDDVVIEVTMGRSGSPAASAPRPKATIFGLVMAAFVVSPLLIVGLLLGLAALCGLGVMFLGLDGMWHAVFG